MYTLSLCNIINFKNLIKHFPFTLEKYEKTIITPKYLQNNRLQYSCNYTLHILYNNYYIKIITDFYNYVYASSDNYNLSDYNIAIIFTNKLPYNILSLLNKNFLSKKNQITDKYNLYQEINTFSKADINYNDLKKHINNELLLIEIKKINTNKSYNHFITFENNNFIVNLILNNVIKFKLHINTTLYPNVPPKLEYISPRLTFEFTLAIMNLNILKINKWSSSITLEQLILEIAKLNFNQYIISDNYDNLEFELIKLLSITNDNISYLDKNINIDINIANIKKNNIDNKFWKSGTGYSYNNNNTVWDINTYLNDQKKISDNINDILIIISDLLIKNPNNKYIDILLEFINIKIKSLTLLELNNNIPFYKNIFTILYILYDYINQDNINTIANNVKDFYHELNILHDNPTLELDIYINKIFDVVKLYYNTIQNNIANNIINNNYIDVMKELQYDTFELPSYHMFYNTKNEVSNKKSIIRIMSEVSSLKSTLPLSNDSSIWIRISEDNFNIITFLISGPKNTPYENGLFEFHCCLPHNYPIEPPRVLLHTTGNKTFRFNPNLYDTGKICLSLLGTWESTVDEKWNPTTSTLLQVLVSIQSLIFIEEPYFNEPGYERYIGTENGIRKSLEYNNNIYPNTIKLAMIDMIKNPPKGFEEIVNNHFKFKKNDIINTITKWNSNNNIMNCNELIELLNEI